MTEGVGGPACKAMASLATTPSALLSLSPEQEAASGLSSLKTQHVEQVVMNFLDSPTRIRLGVLCFHTFFFVHLA